MFLEGGLSTNTRVVCGGGSILGCVGGCCGVQFYGFFYRRKEFTFVDLLLFGVSLSGHECLAIGIHLHHHAPVIG